MHQLVCFVFVSVNVCIDYTQNTRGDIFFMLQKIRVKIRWNKHAIELSMKLVFCHKHRKMYFDEHKDEGFVLFSSMVICSIMDHLFCVRTKKR